MRTVHDSPARILALACLWLALGLPDRLNAQAESLTALAVLDSAVLHTEKVINARNSLKDAEQALADTAFWKSSRLGLNGSYRGSLPESSAAQNTRTTQDPWSGGASFSIGLPANVSLSASAQLSGSYSLSASWAPLAANSTISDARLKVELAGLALRDAEKQARLEAAEALVSYLSAEAESRSARLSLDRALLDLEKLRLLETRGETDRLSILKAEAQATRARSSLARAELNATRARTSLAQKAGGETGKAILAGTKVTAQLDMQIAEWQVPAFQPHQWNKAVAESAARLSNLEQSAWFSGNGPLSLQASLDSTGSFSLSGSFSLDWKLVSGSTFNTRQSGIQTAREAYAKALETARTTYDEALVQVQLSAFNLEIAQAQLASSRIDYQKAAFQRERGEILDNDYLGIREALAKAELDLELAKLELYRARLVLE